MPAFLGPAADRPSPALRAPSSRRGEVTRNARSLPDRWDVAGTHSALNRSRKNVRDEDLADFHALDHNGNFLSFAIVGRQR